MAIPVAIIICREITMSSLREWAAASGGGAHKVRQEDEDGERDERACASAHPVFLFSLTLTPPLFSPRLRQAVKVNSLGKWKTALQMVAMSVILVLRRAEAWLPVPRTAAGRAALGAALASGMRASLALLWAGTFLAVLSLYYYMANVWHFFLYPDGGRPAGGGVPVGSAAASPARAGRGVAGGAVLPPPPPPAAAAANGRGRTRRAAAGR